MAACQYRSTSSIFPCHGLQRQVSFQRYPAIHTSFTSSYLKPTRLIKASAIKVGGRGSEGREPIDLKVPHQSCSFSANVEVITRCRQPDGYCGLIFHFLQMVKAGWLLLLCCALLFPEAFEIIMVIIRNTIIQGQMLVSYPLASIQPDSNTFRLAHEIHTVNLYSNICLTPLL